MPPDAEPSEPRPPRGRWQFSLASLMLVTALVAVLAAGFGGMLRAAYGQTQTPARYFVLMTIATPLAVMFVVSLAWLAMRFLSRRRH